MSRDASVIPIRCANCSELHAERHNLIVLMRIMKRGCWGTCMTLNASSFTVLMRWRPRQGGAL